MTQSLSQKYPRYYKNVAHLTEVDVYQVHNLFGISDHSGAIHHASKKLLLAGVRTGGKPAIEDIREARDTLTRYLEIQAANDPQPAPVAQLKLVVDNTKPAANEPQVSINVPTDPRWVILYYYLEDDRRFKPRQYYYIAPTRKAAQDHFDEFYPGTTRVWIEKVTNFKEGGAEAQRLYWSTR